ncbi:MAG: single-stranded-DNA-specific exonuclease RecJ [Chloroflexi bacterium]|nr:single-stranded-DNA-specific exonuclease RecJ [Chloroflexota bacterium]
MTSTLQGESVPPRAKHWVIAPDPSPEIAARLSHLHPLLVRVLARRGITSAEEAAAFLEGSEISNNPYRLAGVSEAVTRLRYALRRGERIAVYGDFDADGVTSTALMTVTLQSLGGDVRPYIPHRVDEGYGLNFDALGRLREEGCRVVVTVDCGIRSVEEVAYGQRLGMDMIITDHHSIGPELPPARAVINPKRADSRYPFDSLAGVGVAYHLARGLLRAAAHDRDIPDGGLREQDLLDLVALGTVADIVPLLGENRDLVRHGLERLNEPTRRGMLALMDQAGVRPGRVTATTIGYILGPRINAAGRLSSGMLAFELLTTDDPARALTLAAELNRLNQRRQDLTRRYTEDALMQLEEDAYLHLVAAPHYEHGVVGLVASQIVEATYRPAIVVRQEEEVSRGSARSIPEFNITRALDRCRDLLVRHGGHAAAAGFTVRNEHLSELKDRLQAIAREELSDEDLVPRLYVDAVVELSELNRDMYEQLRRVEPCGHGNEQPVLVAHGVTVRSCRAVGADQRHLRLTVSDGRVVFDAIAFQQGEWVDQMPARVDLAFTFEVNEWNGRQQFQLNVLDWRPAGEEGG